MAIARRSDSKQALQQTVQAGGGEKVATPHHVGDALEGIVNDDSDVICRQRATALQRNVAPNAGVRGHGTFLIAFAELLPGEVRRRKRESGRHVETQGRRLPAWRGASPLSANSWIERRAVRIAP